MAKKDKQPDVELNAIVEGIAAIQRGDVEVGAEALRFAQDVQEQREQKTQDNDRKK